MIIHKTLTNRCVSLFQNRNVLYIKNALTINSKCLLTNLSVNNEKTRFIPMSSRTLFQKLLEEKDPLDRKSIKNLEQFAIGLDYAILNHHYSLLPELMDNYEPLNPDSDYTNTRRLDGHKELINKEFWFLQKFSYLLEKIGFDELEKRSLENIFKKKSIGRGVMADMKYEDFAVLRCWVMGKENTLKIKNPTKVPNLFVSAKNFISPTLDDTYRRVVIAIRNKKSEKISLKLFKDVPTTKLIFLLPPADGGLTMSPLYKKFVYLSSALSAFFLFIRIFGPSFLGQIPGFFSLIFATSAVFAWAGFKNQQKCHMESSVLATYHGLVLGNSSLIGLVVEKLREEIFKGVLLSYKFLEIDGENLKKVAQRRTGNITGINQEEVPDEMDKVKRSDNLNLTQSLLEERINSWLKHKTNQEIQFDCNASLQWLHKLGLLSINSSLESNFDEKSVLSYKLIDNDKGASDMDSIKNVNNKITDERLLNRNDISLNVIPMQKALNFLPSPVDITSLGLFSSLRLNFISHTFSTKVEDLDLFKEPNKNDYWAKPNISDRIFDLIWLGVNKFKRKF